MRIKKSTAKPSVSAIGKRLISPSTRQKAVCSQRVPGSKFPTLLTNEGKNGEGSIPPEKNIITIEIVNKRRIPVCGVFEILNKNNEYEQMLKININTNVLINKKISQKELIRGAGVSANILTRLKRNEYISVESIEKICNFLCVFWQLQ